MKTWLIFPAKSSCVFASADVTTRTFGNQTFMTGVQNGQQVNTTMRTFGNQTFTQGNVGGKTFNPASRQFGNRAFHNTAFGLQKAC